MIHSHSVNDQSDFFSIAPWRNQMLEGGRTVVWYSCGATSAVAAHLAIKKYKGVRPVHLVYTDTGSEHPDNRRFMADCEQWLGIPIEIIKNPRYKDVDDVILKERYLNGIEGAKCTGVLKKAMRHQYQRCDSDIQVFGFDARPKEIKRAARFRKENPEVILETPLIEAGLVHQDCLAILRELGIELPMMYKLGFKNNNCFTGQTRFITPYGLKSLEECSGQRIPVLTRAGWRDAEIRSFGKQSVSMIQLSNGRRRSTIITTPNHRWIVEKYPSGRGHVVERLTSELRIGHRPLINYIVPKLTVDRVGFQHGFTFGDGTRYFSDNNPSGRAYCKIWFAPNKLAAALWFDSELTSGHIYGLPAHFKNVPEPKNSSYTLGFICGLIASDGCVSKTGIVVHNKSEKAISKIVNLALSLGLAARQNPTIIRDTNFKKGACLSSLTIPKDSFRIEWLIKPAHKERFGHKRTKAKAWRVDSIDPISRRLEVFCASVNGDLKEFTLEGNILTGNCIGCVKGGAGYWNKIRTLFPEVFARRAAQERLLNHALCRLNGRDVFLDELPPDAGIYETEPDIECGVLCGSVVAETADCAI